MPYILGVDAAWTSHNPSGVSLVHHTPGKPLRVTKLARSYDEFLERDTPDWDHAPQPSPPLLTPVLQHCYSRGFDVQVVALDIPLAPQPVRGYREADRALSRAYSRRGAPVHSPTPARPGAVSDTLYQQLVALGFQWAGAQAEVDGPSFIEVYPHAAIIELFGYAYRLPYKVQRRAQYWKEASPEVRYRKSIEKLMELRHHLDGYLVYAPGVFLPPLDSARHYTLTFLKGYEDVLDSLVSALVGYTYWAGKATAYGNDEGAIWVPDPGVPSSAAAVPRQRK